MSDVSPMTWTPEAYLKIMKVDTIELLAEIEDGIGHEDKSFYIGRIALYVGKLQDNLGLLSRSWRETHRSGA